jgi:DnaJ-class molecular chaperone
VAGEPEIRVRYPCERCNGTGRMSYDPPDGIPAPGSETHLCVICNGDGELRREWVPISQVRDLFA